MIKIENLTYRYNDKKILFNVLNLELLPGKVYGLLGKNGAGKSSLIKNIAGLLFPTKGSCTVNNREPRKRETAFLEEIFFIPEECELPALYINNFIEIYAPFYPSFNRQQFADYLKIFNVQDDSHLKRLSFGQKKKTYIAFAIAANTKLLIMDEPTNGLDIPSKIQFRNIVSNVNRTDKITIISTHQVRDLDDLISDIIILDNGELLLYEDKAAVTNMLYFSTGEIINKEHILYQEPTPQGIVTISLNVHSKKSYPDIEIFFNATIGSREKMIKAFQ